MTELKIYGASDDLIVIEGDISDEFNPRQADMDDDQLVIAISDGTVVGVRYDSNGIWRLTLICRGTSEYSIDQNPLDDEDRYSDVVTLKNSEFNWVIMGTRLAR
jgi:hypothetical protein